MTIGKQIEYRAKGMVVVTGINFFLVFPVRQDEEKVGLFSFICFLVIVILNTTGMTRIF